MMDHPSSFIFPERDRERDSHDELSDYLSSQEGLEVNSGSNLLCLIFFFLNYFLLKVYFLFVSFTLMISVVRTISFDEFFVK